MLVAIGLCHWIVLCQFAHECFHRPNASSAELAQLRTFGRFVGITVLEGCVTGVRIAAYVWRCVLGVRPTPADVCSIDASLAQQLQWMAHNSVNDLYLRFAIEEEASDGSGKVWHRLKLECTQSMASSAMACYLIVCAQTRVRELIPGGAGIDVTDDNKDVYIRAYACHKLDTQLQSSVTAFITGLSDVLPIASIRCFTAQELAQLFCGSDELDVSDIAAHSVASHGYTYSDTHIQWLWEVVQSWSEEEQRSFLRFVTGSSSLPPGGAQSLQPPLTIHRVTDTSRLPSASVCFNLLKLPAYSQKAIMEQRLRTAVGEGSEGFGLS